MAPDWLGKDMLETLKLAQVLLVLVPPLRTSSPYHLLVIGCTLPTRILTKATELNCVECRSGGTTRSQIRKANWTHAVEGPECHTECGAGSRDNQKPFNLLGRVAP